MSYLYGYESHHILCTDVSLRGKSWIKWKPESTAQSTSNFRSRNSPTPRSASVLMENMGIATPAPLQGGSWQNRSMDWENPVDFLFDKYLSLKFKFQSIAYFQHAIRNKYVFWWTIWGVQGEFSKTCFYWKSPIPATFNIPICGQTVEEKRVTLVKMQTTKINIQGNHQIKTSKDILLENHPFASQSLLAKSILLHNQV